VTYELFLAAVILVALVLYALLGGADFGGGILDMVASGPRADDQRRLIANAIGPIWEANHVWLIAVIVLLFSCFPKAYATIATALHFPLTIMLFGIVLRGSAFVFRTYDTQRDDVFHGWSRVFAIGSLVAPYMLGVSLGAAASGRIRLTPMGTPVPDFWTWLAPFPLLCGFFVLAVFTFLAAVYLTLETDDVELQEAFRARALGAAVAVTVLAWLTWWAAGSGAPRIREGLTDTTWAIPFQLVTASLGVAIVHALVTRAYTRARALAIVQVVAVVCGFCAAQYPFIVTPDITFTNAAADSAVMRVVSLGMAGGLTCLAPAYVWMMRVFKDR
jgi:cytochrome d ubiquinol oxidase subunit II